LEKNDKKEQTGTMSFDSWGATNAIGDKRVGFRGLVRSEWGEIPINLSPVNQKEN